MVQNSVDRKRLLFISRRDDRHDYDTADSMAASLQGAAKTMSYEACFLEEVAFAYDGKELTATNVRTGEDLSAYGGIFLLGWFKLRRHEDTALTISLYAQAKGIKIINSEALHNRSRSKLSQNVLAALYGTAATPFIIGMDKDYLVEAAAASQLGFPMIVKSASASRGSHNYLVHDAEDMRRALKAAPPKIFVVQPFVPNEGDYRLLVMGGRVRMAIHRRSVGDSHLNNTSQGGQATIIDVGTLPPAMLADAVKIATLLKREVTGVDMIVHTQTGRHYFLEANNMPQLSTGSFVAEKAVALDRFFESWIG